MELLAALFALLCIHAPACGAEGCSGFRHLENGQTFFRYSGLLVIFRCHSGYKLHGYKTNSCVSGHWSRDIPVCVGSGCSNPGPLTHGTSSMNEDGSWAVFSCDSGFRLHGASMLYCKGHTWNSTMPVCKESDMMSSILGVNVQKPNVHQNLQAAVDLKTQQQSHYDTHANTASKEANLKFGLFSFQFPHFKVKDGLQGVNEAQGPATGSGRDGSEEEAEKVDTVTQVLSSKSHLSTTASSTLSLVSATERSTSSPASFSSAHTPAVTITAVKTEMLVPTSPLNHMESAVLVFGSKKAQIFGDSLTATDYMTPSEVAKGSSQTADEDQQAETVFLVSIDNEEPTETSAYTLSTSVNVVSTTSSLTSSPVSPALSLSPSFSAPASTTSTQSSVETQLPNVTLPSNTSTDTEPRFYLTENLNLTMNATSKPPLLFLGLHRRPVCPYPPVPAHGTFYFRNVENPGPREYRHYIQYACYPGYTLAHGDVHSYCQQGGTWTGNTPVCLESTPCSVNNGGCSQLCSQHNQSSNQTRTQCHCRPGFTLLDDGRTCRDVDECVEGQHQCQQRCINTFGSFKCSCDGGYQPAHDQISCTDVDECLLPVAVTGCVFGCVNTPGSFHCQCSAGYRLQTADSHCQDIDECADNEGLGPCMEQCHNSPGSYRCSCTYGHILAGNGHDCVAECPPGYRKQPTTTPANSTAQALTAECVDINECEEDRCGWQCVNLPGSYRCICPRGYTLQRDGRRCKDINECSRRNGGCSHLCVNQRGGHKCACPASHRLSPYSWKKCLPRMTANTAGRAGRHLIIKDK